VTVANSRSCFAVSSRLLVEYQILYSPSFTVVGLHPGSVTLNCIIEAPMPTVIGGRQLTGFVFRGRQLWFAGASPVPPVLCRLRSVPDTGDETE
jgi:hypothetical protein